MSQNLYTLNNTRVPRKEAKSAKEALSDMKQSCKKDNQPCLLRQPICAASKEQNFVFVFFQTASMLFMIRCGITVVQYMSKVVK